MGNSKIKDPTPCFSQHLEFLENTYRSAIENYLNTYEDACGKFIDKKTDKVLGAHMIGIDAAEIIQGIGIAVKAGLTKADFDSTVAIHPSSAEEFVLMR